MSYLEGFWKGLLSWYFQSSGLESFLFRYKRRAELGELGMSKKFITELTRVVLEESVQGSFLCDYGLSCWDGRGDVGSVCEARVSTPGVIRHGRGIPDLSGHGTLWGQWSGRK